MSGVSRGWLLVAWWMCACGSKDEKPSAMMGEQLEHREEQQRQLRIARVASSSSHAPSAGYTFVPTNLVDGSLTTSWQPAKTDKGPHWVKFDLDDESVVTSIAVANGFQTKDRYGDEFLLNRRIASGRVRFEDGDEIRLQFDADTRGLVRFPVARKRTRTLELLVDETHAGTKWKDLAISEVEVTGIVEQQAVAVSRASGPESEWWTPPGGERKDIEALAHGFAGIDENDLGTLFTADLKPVHGAANLFEQKPPRRVPRDQMQHLVVKLRQSAQLDAGFRYLFAKAGASYKNERDYQVVRALQVREIVRLDDSARMRRPPDEAVFYLAEVHRGASYDLLVEGEHSAMGAQLELLFGKGEGAAKYVREHGAYRLKAFGLGLRDVTGDGMFAMTPDEIADRYRTGDPVPVQLVFRSIPGRAYKAKELPIPQAVIDEAMMSVGESGYRSWTVRPGRYWIEAKSKPNGMALTWQGDVICDQKLKSNFEYGEIKMNCTVSGDAQLVLKNPSMLNSGPTETMSLYVAKQR